MGFHLQPDEFNWKKQQNSALEANNQIPNLLGPMIRRNNLVTVLAFIQVPYKFVFTFF